jgi:DNA polymerase-3 subunit epsilon
MAPPLALQLARPLAFVDLETTGTNTSEDRIVEIALVIHYPDAPDPNEDTTRVRRLNPGVPIPAEATAVHGISDSDVANEPRFGQVAASLHELLDPCDLAGYNLRRFDFPLLRAEFRRVGLTLDHRGRHLLDLQAIYFQQHPRDFSAAVREYLGREHEGAHEALADTEACVPLLEAMIARHGLPAEIEGLHTVCDEFQPFVTELEAWFGPDLEQPVFQRGKHQGKALEQVPDDYLDWMTGRAKGMDPDVVSFVREWRGGTRR